MAQQLTAVLKTSTLIGVRVEEEEEKDEGKSQSLHRGVRGVSGWLVGVHRSQDAFTAQWFTAHQCNAGVQKHAMRRYYKIGTMGSQS